MLLEVETATKEDVVISRKEYEELLDIKRQLADLQRMIFGSKSERFISVVENQLELFQSETPAAEQEVEYEDIAFKRRKKDSGKEKGIPSRALLADHIPRVERVIEPENLVEGSRKIGEEVTEVLEYNPAHIFVTRIVRPKYVLPNNEGFVIADLPCLPIPRGNAGASMLAHIQVSKWVDHLPYYRQIQMFKRIGVDVSSSTINSWFNFTCDLIAPVYDLMVRFVQDQPYLQADESPIKVLESEKKKATHTGYHWVYHAPLIKMVVFDYQPTRSRSGPKAFLKDFKGTLQTDGYTAYNDLFGENKEQNTLLACMAHARRYFEKAIDNDEKRAEWMLTKIQRLYAIERQLKEEFVDIAMIEKVRRAESVPVLEEMKAWLDENIHQVAPKSGIGKAIAYMLRLWPRLIGYTQRGEFMIDNNPIENTIRPLAVGRKNYLFAGSHKAAQQAAMMYSFFGTCKLIGVDPYKWLKHVLEVIPEHKANRLEELLPYNFIGKKDW